MIHSKFYSVEYLFYIIKLYLYVLPFSSISLLFDLNFRMIRDDYVIINERALFLYSTA